jgi:peptide/nickel transport system substrate-binding protein
VRQKARFEKAFLKKFHILLSLVLLCGCKNAEQGAGSPGDRISIAITNRLRALHPVFSTDGSASDLVPLVSDGLVATYRGENLLAESIETSDAKTWRIKLRSGVRFHDGSLLTADDVLNSFELVRNQPGRAVIEDRFGSISELRRISPLELEVILREPMPVFRTYLTFGILPARLFPVSNASRDDFLRHPIGTGPFRLVSYGETKAEFERNGDYFRGLPALSRVSIRYFPSSEEAWVEFVRGRVDMVLGAFADAEALSQISSHIRARFIEPAYAYSLALHSRGGKFGDPVVRRAIASAIDRGRFQSLSRYVDGGGPEWIPAAKGWKTGSPVAYDPAETRRLLDSRGWRLGAGSKIRTKGGEEFRFPLYYSLGDDLPAKAARVIASDLIDVGVKAVLEPMPMNAIREKVLSSKGSAAIHFYPPYEDPDRLRIVFHGSETKDGNNYSGYADPELDRVLDSARKEIDRSRRERMYIDALNRIRDATPSVFLFWRHLAIPMSDCWENVSMISGSIFSTLWRWSCRKGADVP